MNIFPVKVINNGIYVLNESILAGRPKTYLSASITANTQATLSVFSIIGFSAGNYYAWIGAPGSGNAEIIKLHASTAPSGTTVTLASNVLNAHDANEPVWFINCNQWEFWRATTTTGTKTSLAKQNIDATKLWTIYLDASNTTGYAFANPYNVAATSYPFGSGNYSAPAPYANADYNTVEFLINEASSDVQVEITGELTFDKCINWINECLRDIRKYKNKISWAQSINTVLSQTATGVYRYSLPTDIYDKFTKKAIERISLGGEVQLDYVDPVYFFDVLMHDVHVTQVRTAVTGGAGTTTLEIDNSYDFEDSGTVMVGGVEITYTGVTRSSTAGVLTGIPASGTGSMTANIAVDDFVWQGETESKPYCWTLHNGYLYIWYLPDSSWINYNIYIDYYKVITEVDSLEDVIDYIQYEMVKNYLKWRIKSFSKGSDLDTQDSYYQLYLNDLNHHIKKDSRLNKFVFRNAYDINGEERDINPKQIERGTI